MIKINNGISSSITETTFSATCRFAQLNVIPVNEVGMYGSILMYKEYNGLEYEMYNMSTYQLTNSIISSQLSIRYQLQSYSNTANGIGLMCLAIPDVTKVIETIGELNYSANRRQYEYYIYQNELWWVQDEKASIYPDTDSGWGKIDLVDQEEVFTLFYSKASMYEWYYDSLLLFSPNTSPSPDEEWEFETQCVDGMVTITGSSNLGNVISPIRTDYPCDNVDYTYNLECGENNFIDIIKSGNGISEIIPTTYECDGGLCEPWQRLIIEMNKCDNFTLKHDGSEFTYYPVIRDYDNPMTEQQIANFNITQYPFSVINRVAPDKPESILDMSEFNDGMYLVFMIYQNQGIWNHVIIPMYKLCAMKNCYNKMIKEILCQCDCSDNNDCEPELEKQKMYELNKLIAVIKPVMDLIRLRVSIDGQILPNISNINDDYYDLSIMIKKMNIMIDRCGLCNDNELDCGCN